MTSSAKLVAGSLLTLGTGATVWGGYATTRPEDVKDQLRREGIEHLSLTHATSGTDKTNNDYEEWQKILKNGKDTEDTKVKEFGGWGQTENEEHKKINKLKDKCKAELDIPYSSDSFYKSLENAKQFCVKKPSLKTSV